jgi:1-acyl-sn-glycerol-3-phosphate acyltransferase
MFGVWRAAVLFCSLLEVLGRFGLVYLASGGRVSLVRRAEWLHASCARVAKRLDLLPAVREAAGQVAGLTVSNHLTYLDIVVFGAVRPFLFVAKSEVKRWPLLGTLATLGGSIFVERDRSLQVADAGREIEQGLRSGLPVLLFPEGTSSGGEQVLPFRPPLFEPAIRASVPVTAAAIRYTTEEQVAYWGDMVFLPHLLRTLRVRGLAAEVCFSSPRFYNDRKTAARVTRAQVQGLRSTGADDLGASPFTESPVDVVDMLSCPPSRKTIYT